MAKEDTQGAPMEEDAESVEDTLRAAFAEGDGEAEAAVENNDAEQPRESAESAPDADGETEPAEEGKEADASQGGDTGQEGADPDETAEEGPLDPPQDWSAEEHEMFREQPRKVQQWLLDKAKSFESDYTQKTQEIAKTRHRLESLDSVLEPIKQVWSMEGMDESQGLRTMIALEGYARQRPADFIKWFAQARNIDLRKLTGAPQPGNGHDDAEAQSEAQYDPNFLALHHQFQGLHGETQSLKTELERERRERQDREAQQYQRQIDDFRAATDAKGAPAHPYYDQVRGLMAVFIKEGKAQDLNTAYDMAVRADSEVWRKITLAEKAKADAEAARDRRKRATDARRAGSSITGAPAGSSPRQPKEDAAEELAAVAQEAGWQI